MGMDVGLRGQGRHQERHRVRGHLAGDLGRALGHRGHSLARSQSRHRRTTRLSISRYSLIDVHTTTLGGSS